MQCTCSIHTSTCVSFGCREISSAAVTIVSYGLIRYTGSNILREALQKQKFKVLTAYIMYIHNRSITYMRVISLLSNSLAQ